MILYNLASLLIHAKTFECKRRHLGHAQPIDGRSSVGASNLMYVRKTDRTTLRQGVVCKLFNALYVPKIIHEYHFVYHCVAI